MEDGDGVLGEDGADDDGLLQRAVALLAQRDQETLEERPRLEQGLPDRLGIESSALGCKSYKIKKFKIKVYHWVEPLTSR